MSDAKFPTSMDVSLSSLIGLAIEWWRLSSALASGSSAPARHALRKIEDFLHECDLEVYAMDGKAFDPGFAMRVIDAVDDPALPADTMIVDQTVSPMVLWRGGVVKSAEVITRRGPSKKG